MKKLKSFFIQRQGNKGQSFVEMTIVVGILLVLLMGVVEIGYLLNRYITLVDASRAGARFGSSDRVDPYIRTTSPYTVNSDFYTQIDYVIDGDSNSSNPGALGDLRLKPTTDDVVITFYRIANGNVEQTFGPWHKYAGSGHPSQITLEFVRTQVIKNNAPNTGVLVIEIFYSSAQLVKFPIFTNIIPDPIPVYAYSIMPLVKAKPTEQP